MISPLLALVENWFVAIVQVSWQAGVIAFLVFSAQFVFRKHLSPRWRYALWFLVAVRLVIPTLPESPLSLQRLLPTPSSLIPASASPALTEGPEAGQLLPPPPDLAVQQSGISKKIAVTRIFGMLWLSGMLIISLRLLLPHGRFLWSLRSAPPYPENGPLQELLAACAQELNLRGKVRILETALISSPALCGTFRPVLLLPKDFKSSFSPGEQRMIFLHELAHVRRGDLLVNPLLSALQIVHWFNPVLWFAFSRMRFDRECATDSLVLSGERVQLKDLYGHTLLKLVERLSFPSSPPRLLGVLEDKKRLQERFRSIAYAKPGAYGLSALGVILLLGMGIATLTRSTATDASDQAEKPSSADLPSLTPNASKDETRTYVAAVLKGSSVFANSSLQDPQISDLKKVGPENIDILIEENARHTVLGVTNPTTNYYLSMAICDLARPQDREIVVNALPQNRYLVYAVLRMNWAQDARDELLRVFRTEPGRFAPGWIEAIASLHDPSTYDELKNYLITGNHREHTYKALKKIPDIGDLKATVEKAWPLAKNRGSYEARDMAKIAAGYGIPDAAAYLQSHSPDPVSKKQAAADRQFDPTEDAMAGGKLTAEEADKLAAEVEANPNDLGLRMKLLGYYFLKRTMQASARDAAQPHILWIINHQPASPAAGLPYVGINNLDPVHFAEGRTAWMKQVADHPENAAILGNAAAFLQLGDPLQAEKLLRQARTLEPADSRWSERLAVFLTLQSRNGTNPLFPHAQKEALLAYEDALKGKEGEKRFYLLTSISQTALDAGDEGKAYTYADQLLEIAPSFRGNWNYGNAIYAGNSVLGLLALRKGDPAAAGKHLLAAGDTPGSPQLNSFGPEFSLAQQLLEAGQGETVITFLGKVATFWKGHEARIKEWQNAIGKGESPKLARFGS